MNIRVGTNAFTSFHAACRHYAHQSFDTEDVQRKLDDGEITLTKPTPAKGQTVYADYDGRYWIEDVQQ